MLIFAQGQFGLGFSFETHFIELKQFLFVLCNCIAIFNTFFWPKIWVKFSLSIHPLCIAILQSIGRLNIMNPATMSEYGHKNETNILSVTKIVCLFYRI